MAAPAPPSQPAPQAQAPPRPQAPTLGAPPRPPDRDQYHPLTDWTLTRNQAAIGGIRPDTAMATGNLRDYSYPTLGGHSSGYHESVITTDTFRFLWDARPTGKGTHVLPTVSRPVLGDYALVEVDDKVRDFAMRYADSFRTDTAQTILVAPGGRPAPHSGSDLSTKLQDKAHDALREKALELVSLDPATPGFTELSLGTVFGAMTVASMAPGEVVRTLAGGGAGLKGGDEALDNWEENRNEAKLRIDEVMSGMSDDERKFVITHASDFLDRISRGGSVPRKTETLRARSPDRDAGIKVPGQAAGGGYLSGGPVRWASESPPADSAHLGLYLTAPFRAARRPAV